MAPIITDSPGWRRGRVFLTDPAGLHPRVDVGDEHRSSVGKVFLASNGPIPRLKSALARLKKTLSPEERGQFVAASWNRFPEAVPATGAIPCHQRAIVPGLGGWIWRLGQSDGCLS